MRNPLCGFPMTHNGCARHCSMILFTCIHRNLYEMFTAYNVRRTYLVGVHIIIQRINSISSTRTLNFNIILLIYYLMCQYTRYIVHLGTMYLNKQDGVTIEKYYIVPMMINKGITSLCSHF